MKKLLPLLLCLAFATTSRATLTFTLVTPPCDTNGVLVVQYTGFSLPPFNVSWSYGVNYVNHTISGFTDTIRNFNGQAFTYVSVNDSTGVMIDTGYYIGTPPLTFTLSSTTAVCPAMPTINATVTAGTGPFTYKWYDVNTGAIVGTTSTLAVPPGQYGIWITNGAGCASGTAVTGETDSVTSTVTFMDSLTTTPANCTNGTASLVTVSGLYHAPLSYLWSNGSTATSISGLTQGTYTLIVSDSAGCSYTSYANVSQLTTITANTTPTPATCVASDGAIIGFGAGGMPPYTYLWSNGATTASQTGLSTGTYNLTVTDANGCTGYGAGYVGVSTPISVVYTTTPSSCTAPTGTASIVISGGTTPYRDTFYTSPLQTSTIATALGAGTYMFHVVDAHGCIQNGSVVVPPIDNMALSFVQTPATCTLSNGSMSVYVSGGVAPLSYAWNTGATASAISGVPTGWYTVTVTDANSCTKTKYSEVFDYSPMSLGLATVPASCIFTHDGIATVTPFGGTPPYTYSWSNGGITPTIGSLATGPYWAFVTDHLGCTAGGYDGYTYVDYNTLDSSCFCMIKGCVYHDINVNCTREAGENGIPNIQVYCSGIGYTYTDDSGNYSFMVPTGTYTISESIQVYYPLAGCQMNNITVAAIADSGCVHIVDFANLYDTLHDMQVSTWDYNQAVPGNPYTQVRVIHNAGSITETAPVASVKTDAQIFGASFIPSGVYGGSTSYDYQTLTGTGLGSMAPGASQTFIMDYNVPTFIPLGTNLVFVDTVAYIAPLDSWITDYTPWNNVDYFNTTVVAGYDPNFKEVSPKGVGASGVITTADSNLQYMVHFQNTGTANAQNVMVIDTLDNNLNWASLRPIYSSSPCTITQSNTGKYAKFTFNNINLPPKSTNAMNSNGYFVYSIKMKTGLSVGDQIRNNASIYFDYNAPVKTNTTLNTIGWPTEVHNVAASNEFFTIFPNPAGSSFKANINSGIANNNAELQVTDITGKTLMSKKLVLAQGAQTISVDVSGLASGIYLVTINNNGNMQTNKLAIIK